MSSYKSTQMRRLMQTIMALPSIASNRRSKWSTKSLAIKGEEEHVDDIWTHSFGIYRKQHLTLGDDVTGRLRSFGDYWKSRHADALKRIEKLKEELEQSRGETRALQDKLFGRKSEKSARGDRSNDLVDPEEVSGCCRRSEARSPAMRGTAGATIPICRSRKSSSHCRRNRCSARIAESRPR